MPVIQDLDWRSPHWGHQLLDLDEHPVCLDCEGLPDSARAKILGLNAARVFDLPVTR